jgi:hypothetical protein
MFTTRRRFAALVTGSLVGLAGGLPALARDDDAPPNVFFSPHGKPFRAVDRAPYPVADWFREADRKGGGQLGREDFVADAAAFFDVLDLNGDGVLDANEISAYEHNIAPEVLGVRVTVLANGALRLRPPAARLWLAQYGPMDGGPFGNNNPNSNPTGLSGAPGGQDHRGADEGGVLPQDVRPNAPDRENPGAGLVGAALYGLLGDPEPITAADPDYLTHGVVDKRRFMAHAGDNFTRLDMARAGFLTLAALPPTPVQKLLGPRPRKG